MHVEASCEGVLHVLILESLCFLFFVFLSLCFFRGIVKTM
jgi:hypothetical protein